MPKDVKKKSLDFSQISTQFNNLDGSNPASWPAIPKLILLLVVSAGVVLILAFLWLKGVQEELSQTVAAEETLKIQYQDKLKKAVNLEELTKQRAQVQQYVLLLEKQLPGKAEMDALLLDINQAGTGRNLKFDLFKPGNEIRRDYYVELPIEIAIKGEYHDAGDFVADVANLSRIVTLNNLDISPNKDGVLALKSLVKTFRYLDADEVREQENIKKESQAKRRGGK